MSVLQTTYLVVLGYSSANKLIHSIPFPHFMFPQRDSLHSGQVHNALDLGSINRTGRSYDGSGGCASYLWAKRSGCGWTVGLGGS